MRSLPCPQLTDRTPSPLAKARIPYRVLRLAPLTGNGASVIFTFPEGSMASAPGAGENARTCFGARVPARENPRFCRLFRFWRIGRKASSCFSACAVPSKFYHCHNDKLAPSAASRSWILAKFSVPSREKAPRANISPVSRPSSIFIMVTPTSRSPARMARCIGAAPRYFGSSEAWMLMQPNFG